MIAQQLPFSTWLRELPEATATGIPLRQASKANLTTQGITFTEDKPFRKWCLFLAYTLSGSREMPCSSARSRIISRPGTPASAKKLSFLNLKPVSLQMAHHAFQWKGIVSSNVPSQSKINAFTPRGNETSSCGLFCENPICKQNIPIYRQAPKVTYFDRFHSNRLFSNGNNESETHNSTQRGINTQTSVYTTVCVLPDIDVLSLNVCGHDPYAFEQKLIVKKSTSSTNGFCHVGI